MNINTIRGRMLFLLFGMALFLGCENNKVNELGPPASKLEGINGNWIIGQVDHVDLTARPVFDVRVDVSDIMVGDDPLTIDFNSENGTYTSDAGSSKIEFFGTSGTWAFDDDRFPTKISLTNDQGDSYDLELVQTVRPQDNELIFEFAVSCTSQLDPQFGFEYAFDRVQQ